MKISVVLPAYNSEAFIARALQSAKTQLEDLEIIVVDDASGDGTRAAVSGLAASDGRIKLLPLSVNGGPAVARNAALACATGDWIAILDADDAFAPDRLRAMVELGETSGKDIVLDNLSLYDAGVGKIFATTDFFAEEWGLEAFWNMDGGIENMWPSGWVKPLIRTQPLRESGVIYRPELRYAEDFVFLSELMLNGLLVAQSETAGYIYTVRDGPISKQKSALSRTTLEDGAISASVDYLLNNWVQSLTGAEHRALLRRSERIGRQRNWRRFRSVLSDGDFVAAGAKLIDGPDVMIAALYIARSKLRKKVARAPAASNPGGI